MGHAGEDNFTPPPQSFVQYDFAVVNERTVRVNNDTFRYVGFDDSSHLVHFQNASSERHLYFNTIDNSMELNWVYSSSYHLSNGSLNTKYYQPNRSLKDYLPYIVGPKPLSGTAHDTLLTRTPNDSSWTINTTITFTAVNDSTIAFNKGFLFYTNGDTLHHMQTNESKNTVVFQSFRLDNFAITTLTYNYTAHSLAYEQQYRSYLGWWMYLKMQ
jgi:hypothetical protein